jgi:hypothetical protein
VTVLLGLSDRGAVCNRNANVKSAIHFHIETFGEKVLDSESSVFEAFVEEVLI